jgi:hypothetical protein
VFIWSFGLKPVCTIIVHVYTLNGALIMIDDAIVAHVQIHSH